MTSDGELYAPQRFKTLIKERYLIAKHCNTSYLDVGNITPIERKYLISFIEEEHKRTQELINNATKS